MLPFRPTDLLLCAGLTALLAGCSPDPLARERRTWGASDSGAGPDGGAGDAGGGDAGGGDLGDGGGDSGGGSGVRGGPVWLSADGALVDDGGPFVAMGATMMWAAWAYRNDRPRLERNLAFLSEQGFDFVRALGVVGDPDAEDYWDGREIDPDWPDHADVIAGLTDLAWDGYGLRVQWTLIGDGQITVPTWDDKIALADRFLDMSRGREEKILLLEVANEAWQNGFPDAAGNDELRALSGYLRDRTDVLVAASAPPGVSCADWLEVYRGGVADVATLHFDRDVWTEEGAWRPVRLPWDVQACAGLPPASNNEPIGPGSSVASEDDPVRLASAAAVTWVSGLPFYVLHSGAGVRGFEDFADQPGFRDLGFAHRAVAGGAPGWSRAGVGDPGLPFVVWAGDSGGGEHRDAVWTDLGSPAWGAQRVYSAAQGERFVATVIGVRDRVRLEARQALAVTAHDPATGSVDADVVLGPGETLELSGREAWLLVGGTR
ncbi:MAG: hypothetical protein H6742_10190 [Alphaproteobacteria bacterium]|nr:hypothetical protein [Alphaproteobacteria bacterium]